MKRNIQSSRKSNSSWKIKGSAMITTIVCCFVVSMVYVSITHVGMDQRDWRALGADASPGYGNCGILNIFIYPHSADPATTYASNCSEGTAYAYGNSLNSSLTGNVPYHTSFDIVLKYRFNASVAYCETNTTWMMSWVNYTIRSPNLAINANTTMQEVQVTANSTYMEVQFYINNAGNGYKITHAQQVNVTHNTPYAFW